MKNWKVLQIIATAAFVFVLQAMDGVGIATICNVASYKNETTFGTLVKYEIDSGLVVKVDTLDNNAASPRINKSGTYYAFIKNSNANVRTLVIKPLYGNTSSSKEITLAAVPVWLWWQNDGSFLYTTPPGSQKYVRKVTLSSSNGNTVVNDRLWAALPPKASGGFYDGVQGGFVGLSGNGDKIAYSDGMNARTLLISGDSTKVPTTAFVNAIGCGYTISPSGNLFAQWPGSHNVFAWNRWDLQSLPTNSIAFNFFADSASWVYARSTDPERKLEVFTNGAWIKDPIGLMGADNNWSENSENWSLSEVSAGILELGDGDCFNAIAVSLKYRKAINISKIMPVKEVISSRSSFRGITFTGGTQMNADRPTLWVSNKEDVWDSLWHYVENRQQDNEYWSNLTGLPLSQIDVTSVKKINVEHKDIHAVVHVRKIASGYNLTFPGNGAYYSNVQNCAGRSLLSQNGFGNEINLKSFKAGAYLITVKRAATINRYAITLF